MEPFTDWVPSPHVTARDVREGAVLLDLATGQCWELNATGARMWKLLVEAQSARRAIAEIGRAFDQAPDRAASDMERFVERLSQLGAVVRPPDLAPR